MDAPFAFENAGSDQDRQSAEGLRQKPVSKKSDNNCFPLDQCPNG
jgi:hypothetical protein